MNPQKKHATSPKPANLVIRASAGSGKTFQLSNRFLDLVLRDQSVDSILATTFTRKAAGEIEDRVLLRLAEASLDSKKLKELAKFVAAPWLTEDSCLEYLEKVVRQFHRLRISTLDSFFIQIAQGLILEMGLAAGWRIIDDIEDQRLRELAIADLLAREDQADLNRLVNWLTKGKAQRSVAELIRDTVSKLYKVYQEAPSAAWDRIPSRPRLTDEQLDELLAALAVSELPQHKAAVSSHAATLEKARAGLWEEVPSSGLAAKVAAGERLYQRKPISAELFQLYQQLLSHAAATVLDQVRTQTKATYELLDRFHGFYERLKRERKALRFEDVTRHVGAYMAAADKNGMPTADVKLLQQRLAQLTFRLDARLDHLLLDEFQDTSLSQWNVLRPLAMHATSHPDLVQSKSSKEPETLRSFFCVGDGKQAIYGWRGGVADIFEALNKQLRGLQSEPLNTSYRSSPVVIEAVNRVFKNLGRHQGLERFQEVVEAWSERFPKHTTAKENYPGYVALEVGPDEQEGDNAFLKFVTQRIADLAAQAPDKTIGVLVSTNDQIAEIIFGLRALKVSASEEGGNPLTDSAAVQIIMSLLEIADHPGSTIARFHVAESSLGRALQVPVISDGPGWSHLAAEVRQRLMHEGYGEVITSWALQLRSHCDAREWRRLQQLIAAAYRFQPTATLRTRDFIQVIEMRRVADPSDANVVVTTIHKSKGLQYDIVVLPQLDRSLTRQPDSFVVGRPDAISPIDLVCRYMSRDIQEILPPDLQAVFTAADASGITEGLCVLYVALTRAVHALHMIIEPKNNKTGDLPKTFAALLRAALQDELAPLKPNMVCYESGDPNWPKKMDSAKDLSKQPAKQVEAAETVTTPAVKTARIAAPQLYPIVGRRLRGLPRVSPSSLAWRQAVAKRASTSQLARLRDQEELDNPVGRIQGTILHAWLETIEWLRDGDELPSDEQLRAIASRAVTMPLADAFLLPLIEEWRAMLGDVRLSTIFRQADYVKSLAGTAWSAPLRAALSAGTLQVQVYREQRFAYRTDDELVTGIVDRLVILRDHGVVVAVEVIDYKSDEVASDESIMSKCEHYEPQLRQYREAIAETWKIPRELIRSRLVFLKVGRSEGVS
ncbi:MAG: UvrD-helicase domain-containing protein [Planctomycetota bacterium]